MNKVVESPLVSNTGATKLVKAFNTNEIINAYSDIGIDAKRFFSSNTICLYECTTTQYRFFYPLTCIGDALFYKDLSTNRPNYYSVRWEHKKALSYLSKDDFVLEIGSGFGAFLSELKLRGVKAKGIELNNHAVEKCLENGLDVQEMLIQDEAKENPNIFDVVCYFQVLEHITDVHNFIANSLKTIKSKGKLIIGVPNNNPYLFVSDKYHTLNLPPHHAGLWNKKSLKALVKVFPIKMIALEFEPLELNYDYFLNFHLNSSNVLKRLMLKFCNKLFPNILKYFVCKLVSGRNVIAVYEKLY